MKIILPLPPTAWERARIGRHGHFTAPKTRAFENACKAHFRTAMGLLTPYLGPLSLEIIFKYPHLKKQKKDRPYWKPTRSDLDNCLKGVFDAGNKILWHDDGQICSLIAKKIHSNEGPSIEMDFEMLVPGV